MQERRVFGFDVISAMLFVGSYLEKEFRLSLCLSALLRGQDLNLRPPGYEPGELPDCSTSLYYFTCAFRLCKVNAFYLPRKLFFSNFAKQ